MLRAHSHGVSRRGLCCQWFSNRDMAQCVERCVDYESDEYLAIFGMSNNTDMRWDISNPIGYVPQDDVSVEKKRLGILTPRL